MKILLTLTRDLFFQGKIQAAVQNLPKGEADQQWQGFFVRTESDYLARLKTTAHINLALVDLQASQVDVYKLIADTKAGGVPVLAFGRHTDPQSLRQARQAGAVRAVPNSTLVEKFSVLVEQAINPAAPAVPIEIDLE